MITDINKFKKVLNDKSINEEYSNPLENIIKYYQSGITHFDGILSNLGTAKKMLNDINYDTKISDEFFDFIKNQKSLLQNELNFLQQKSSEY